MVKIIECIPNFSEGRDASVIEALAAAAKNVKGVSLADYSSDANHNRSVYTIIGDPDGVAEAAFMMCKTASELIDMTGHTGGHPRMGAADVVPFVPLRNCSVPECVEISKMVAERIYAELGIPVFLYEYSCSAEHRRNLASIRKGGFEGMPRKLLLDGWAPDYGERKIHPTAGVTAVGARKPLIAFNVNLSTADLGVAKRIARKVRESSGGFADCKAIGVMLEDRNIAQVSMNMVNYEGTPLYLVFDAICAEAAKCGAAVVGSEIVGLSPAKALIDCAEHYLKIENFSYERQVLENHLME